MTTLSDRPNTALIVIDLQNDVVAGAHERNAVIADIAALVDRARGDGVPIVWIQHSDEGLQPPREPVLAVPVGAWTHCRRYRDQGSGLQRLNRTRAR